MSRNRAAGRVGWDIIDYNNPRSPDYYTDKEGGEWNLFDLPWNGIDDVHESIHSLCWGSPQGGSIARWDEINGWTNKPERVFV